MLRRRGAISIAGNHDLIGTGRLGFERCSNKAMHSLKRTRRWLAPRGTPSTCGACRRITLLEERRAADPRRRARRAAVHDAAAPRAGERRLPARRISRRARLLLRPYARAAGLRGDGGARHARRSPGEGRAFTASGDREYFVNPGSVDASRKRATSSPSSRSSTQPAQREFGRVRLRRAGDRGEGGGERVPHRSAGATGSTPAAPHRRPASSMKLLLQALLAILPLAAGRRACTARAIDSSRHPWPRIGRGCRSRGKAATPPRCTALTRAQAQIPESGIHGAALRSGETLRFGKAGNAFAFQLDPGDPVRLRSRSAPRFPSATTSSRTRSTGSRSACMWRTGAGSTRKRRGPFRHPAALGRQQPPAEPRFQPVHRRGRPPVQDPGALEQQLHTPARENSQPHCELMRSATCRSTAGSTSSSGSG